MRFIANTGDQVLAFPLRSGSTIIGRHATCHICLPSKSVSRRHAQVYIDGASVVLRDLGSSHGTYVNGQRVERADLRDGDVVSIGGVQMRFEGGMQADAAFGHTAPSAQDVVVTAEPAGPGGPGGPGPIEHIPSLEPEMGPAPAYAQEGAPAPTDFPQSPRGDETPVDQGFVPQTYTAPQPSMLPSATLQPQMVVRDGRWFLRDPRTGREVEIAPKDGALAPATAVPLELRRPNVRLLLVAIGGAVCLILIFALVFFSSPGGGEGPKIPEFPTVQYNTMVDEGIGLFHKSKLDEAIAVLEEATKKRPNIGTSGHVSSYTRLRKSAGTDLDKFNWTEANRYLDSILHCQFVSEAARAFVSEQTQWIRTERDALAAYEAGMDMIRGTEAPEPDALKAAFSALSQIPKDTFAARKAEGEKGKIRTKLFETFAGHAKRNVAEREWPKAVAQWREALAYTDDAASIKKQIADCERFGRDAGELEVARKEFEKPDYDAAAAHLKTITPPSPYADDAKGLLAQIDAAKGDLIRKKQTEEVARLYLEGSAEEALARIKENKVPGFDYIKDRVEQWKKVMGEADAAEKAKNYETALTQFQEAVGVEPDAKNRYHVQAESRLQNLKARFPDIADEIAQGASKDAEMNPRKARAGANRALRFAPDNALAKSILENLQKRASNLYNQGSLLIDKKDWPAAERVLGVARDCADPKSVVYPKILQALEKIPEKY